MGTFRISDATTAQMIATALHLLGVDFTTTVHPAETEFEVTNAGLHGARLQALFDAGITLPLVDLENCPVGTRVILAGSCNKRESQAKWERWVKREEVWEMTAGFEGTAGKQTLAHCHMPGYARCFGLWRVA